MLIFDKKTKYHDLNFLHNLDVTNNELMDYTQNNEQLSWSGLHHTDAWKKLDGPVRKKYTNTISEYML